MRPHLDSPRPVLSIEGLEVDLTSSGPEAIPPYHGLEATPAELRKSNTLHVLPGAEKEVSRSIREKEIFRKIRSLAHPNKRQKGIKTLWVFLVTILFSIAIIVAIAVPLELRQEHSKSKQLNNASFGVLNGTRLAIVNTNTVQLPNYHLYYQDTQHHIRRLEQPLWSSSFTGGPDLLSIATDARERTPLAAVNYTTESDRSTLLTHLFYVDSQNTLQEVISEDGLQTWLDGTLGRQLVKVSTSITTLAAFSRRTTFVGTNSSQVYIRVYYGAPDGLVYEIGSNPNDGKGWATTGSTFTNANGDAGLAAAWSDAQPIVYLYTVLTTGFISRWTLNENSNASLNTPGFPYGLWQEDTAFNKAFATHPLIAHSSLSLLTRSWPGNICYNAGDYSWKVIECLDLQVFQLPLIEQPTPFIVVPWSAGGNALALFYQTNSTNLVIHTMGEYGTGALKDLPV
ncbi:MAG: hypothetical protein Q9218_006163 [Villophora microphyllina]